MTEKPKTDLGTLPDESIGRPGPWRDGRHTTRQAPPEDSVIRKPGEGPADSTSTTVTLDDYEGPKDKPHI